jgi:hypothetical protein
MRGAAAQTSGLDCAAFPITRALHQPNWRHFSHRADKAAVIALLPAAPAGAGAAPRLLVLQAGCTTTSGAAGQLHHDFWCCKTAAPQLLLLQAKAMHYNFWFCKLELSSESAVSQQ